MKLTGTLEGIEKESKGTSMITERVPLAGDDVRYGAHEDGIAADLRRGFKFQTGSSQHHDTPT